MHVSDSEYGLFIRCSLPVGTAEDVPFGLAHTVAAGAVSSEVGQVRAGSRRTVSQPLAEPLCETLAKVTFGSNPVCRQILILYQQHCK